MRATAHALVACALLLGLTESLGAQPSYCDRAGPRRTARAAVATAAVAGNAALYVYFKNAWWSGERAPFHVQNDWDQEFRDQDKLGHLYGGYHLDRIARDLLIAGCVSPRRAAWLAFTYAFLFQFQIEVWDGTQAKYGFSPGDLLFNTIGASYALAQHFHPALAALKPTIWYTATDAMRACRREPRLCGELRTTLDYAGQSYWLSLDIDTLLPRRAAAVWPGWLRVSFGHSVTDWIVAEGNAGCAAGSVQCVRRARRELLLSLDLEASRLPGNHPLWRRVKNELGYLRFPAPALVLTPAIRLEPLYR